MPDRTTDDAALLAAAANGDLDAFESLVREHTRAVYAHALRFFGEPAAAEDTVQEVWIKVYRSLGTFDGRARFSTWLYRVTRNTCLDQVRAGARRPIPVDPIDTIAVPGDLADEVALTASVEAGDACARARGPRRLLGGRALRSHATPRSPRRSACPWAPSSHACSGRAGRSRTYSASRRVVPRWSATTRKTSSRRRSTARHLTPPRWRPPSSTAANAVTARGSCGRSPWSSARPCPSRPPG